MMNGEPSSGKGSFGMSIIYHRRVAVIGGRVDPLFEVAIEPQFVRQWISSSVQMIHKFGVSNCKSLQSIAFDSASQLSRIEGEAFRGSGLKSIHLPASVEVICAESFSECESLASVTFDSGSKLRQFEREAFSWSGLKSIHLPASVVEIGAACFYFCGSLASVTFDSNSRLERIEECAFRDTPLREITLPGGIDFISYSAFEAERLEFVSFCPLSPKFCVNGHFIQSHCGVRLIRHFGLSRSIRIGSSIEVICEGCFQWRASLESISFECPSKLLRIEVEAFARSGLKSIHLPASVEVICEFCFLMCKSLESVTFESKSKLSRIEAEAFGCSGLKSIHLPASVKVISERCFAGCTFLKSITLGPGANLPASTFSAAFRERFPMLLLGNEVDVES
jgi:hypothetical protein